MKHEIIYDSESLESNKPTSFQEDATEVYCWSAVGVILTVVPLVTSIISVFLLPFVLVGALLAPNNQDD